jgi:hypothetical protein
VLQLQARKSLLGSHVQDAILPQVQQPQDDGGGEGHCKISMKWGREGGAVKPDRLPMKNTSTQGVAVVFYDRSRDDVEYC